MRHFSTEKFKSFLLAGTFTAFIGYVNRLSDSVIIGHVIGEVTLDLNDGILMTLRDDGVIFDITDADAKVSSLRTYLVASMMERHRDRINLVTAGPRRSGTTTDARSRPNPARSTTPNTPIVSSTGLQTATGTSPSKSRSRNEGLTMKARNCCVVVAALTSFAASAVQFTVDFSKETGEIRRINGIENSVPLSCSRGGAYKDILKPLEPPRTHLHDDALQNPGYALVDVSRIFPLFHLDADDPRNYNFKPTDDYLKPLVESGIEIDFRLGEAIEHSDNFYRVNPPADFEKWADICSHIIRHYNEGWADGFKWNIRYWSIWEEPDTNPTLLAGPDPFYGSYFQLYKTVAPILKRRFPSIRISGPQCATFPQHVKDFVAFCAKEKLPLDALGWTHYPLRPEDLFDLAKEFRAVLDANGYNDTELNLVEWHYGPVSWSGHGTRNSREHAVEWRRYLNSSDSAAFTVASLILMQDSPVDMMHFYSLKGDSWGLFDGSMQPQLPYYAMLSFAQLAHGTARVAAPVKPQDGWYALASRAADGTGRLLAVKFKSADTHRIKVTVAGGLRPVRVRLLDAVNRLEEISGWDWNPDTSLLRVPTVSTICESAVWLVDFRPAVTF